jgi:anti-sigma factor RsiW
MAMSETTEVRGACCHNWIDLGAWVTADLDESEERAVEAQFASCDTCFAELMDMITLIALLDEAFAAQRQRQRSAGVSGRYSVPLMRSLRIMTAPLQPARSRNPAGSAFRPGSARNRGNNSVRRPNLQTGR